MTDAEALRAFAERIDRSYMTKPTMEKNERRRLNNSRSAKRSRLRRDFPNRIGRLFGAISLLPKEEQAKYGTAVKMAAEAFILSLVGDK